MPAPRPLLALGALAAVLVGLSAGPASAYPDARVEAQITPSFGALLSPPVNRRYRHWRHRAHWQGRVPYLTFSATVDCGAPRAGPTPITDALDRLIVGGTLYVRGASGCRETVEIWKSVTIVGEGGSAFESGPSRAIILAPSGQPCVSIAPGAGRVELRALQLVSDQGGRSACLEAQDTEVALVRTSVRYNGGDAAVYVGGGALILRDSRIEAPTAYAGLVIQDAALTAERSDIASGTLGLDLSLSARTPSRIDDLRVAGPGPGGPMGRRTTGLLVRGAGGPGILPQRLTVSGVMIEGWGNGLWLDLGAVADVSNAHIRRTLTGVLIDGADATVSRSTIGARELGVQVLSGRARIDDNDIYGYMYQPIYVAPGVDFSGRNRIWSRKGCHLADGPSCQPMGLLRPDLRDDDLGWAPPPATFNPPDEHRRPCHGFRCR